jgi:hypothetical protein
MGVTRSPQRFFSELMKTQDGGCRIECRLYGLGEGGGYERVPDCYVDQRSAFAKAVSGGGGVSGR